MKQPYFLASLRRRYLIWSENHASPCSLCDVLYTPDCPTCRRGEDALLADTMNGKQDTSGKRSRVSGDLPPM